MYDMPLDIYLSLKFNSFIYYNLRLLLFYYSCNHCRRDTRQKTYTWPYLHLQISTLLQKNNPCPAGYNKQTCQFYFCDTFEQEEVTFCRSTTSPIASPEQPMSTTDNDRGARWNLKRRAHSGSIFGVVTHVGRGRVSSQSAVVVVVASHHYHHHQQQQELY